MNKGKEMPPEDEGMNLFDASPLATLQKLLGAY